MKRFTLFFTVILAFFLILFASCDNGNGSSAVAASKAPVLVSFDICFGGSASQKTISSNLTDYGIDHYSYKASPKFSYSDGMPVQGDTNGEWVSLAKGQSLWFAPGLWSFEVKAFASSAEDTPKYQGSVTAYINGDVKSITIPLDDIGTGTGTMTISLKIPQLSENGGKLTLDYGLFGGALTTFTGFSASESDGIVTYSATITGLSAGGYICSFMFGDSEVGFSYGETVLVTVVSDSVVSVAGDLPAGQVLVAGQTKNLRASIDSNMCFVCADPANVYTWYVNGTQVKRGSDRVFIFNPTAYTPNAQGKFDVECRLNDSSSTDQIAKASVDAKKTITINLHMNGTVQQVIGYAGLTTADELKSYIATSDIYDGNWYENEQPSDPYASFTPTQYTNTGAFAEGDDGLDLYAHRNKYTVTLGVTNGTITSASGIGTLDGGVVTRKVYRGDAVGKFPTVNASTNYKFYDGDWFTAASGGTRITEATTVTSDATYYAQCISKSADNTWTVTIHYSEKIDYNSGDNWKKLKFKAASIVTMPVRKGEAIRLDDLIDVVSDSVLTGGNADAALKGWFTALTLQKTDPNQDKWEYSLSESDRYNFDTPVESDIDLYGALLAPKKLVKVNFFVNGKQISDKKKGAVIRTQQIDSGDLCYEPSYVPDYGGEYKFAGWFFDAKCEEIWDFKTRGVEVNKDADKLNLHAGWYVEQDYIRCSSYTEGGYIDTGYKPNQNCRIEVNFKYNGAANDPNCRIVGCDSHNFYIGTNRITQLFEAKVGNTSLSSTGYTLYDKDAAVMKLSRKTGFVIGGNNYGTVNPGSSFSPTDTIKLFRTTSQGNYAKGDCLRLKVFDDNKLVRDLVPIVVYSKNPSSTAPIEKAQVVDNIYKGMIDFANNDFYPPVGNLTVGKY